MKEKISVSAVVTCFEHEKYISECLDSILAQKRDFDLTVIVNDDASSDGTPDIIKKYESKYPDVIKPIYQKENQYSKGVFPLQDTLLRAKGEFLAICEGDDFWIDEDKLRIQVDYMRGHPECAMCCHGAKKYSEARKQYIENADMRPHTKDCLLSVEELIEAGGGYLATNSILYRKKYDIGRPDYITSARISDYPLMFYLASCGTVYYFDKFMSAYRVEVPGSWSSGMVDIAKKEKHFALVNKMLREADAFHNGKYHDAFEKRILKNDFDIAYLKEDWDELLKSKYSAIFKETLGESQLKLKTKMKLKKMIGK